jgi:Mg2+/Co2+ transporter CorB
MSFDHGLALAAILLLLIFSAFFSAAETALAGASRTKLVELERRHVNRTAAALSLLDNDWRVGSAIRGLNLAACFTAATIAVLSVIAADVPDRPVMVAAAVIFLIILFAMFANALPRAYARAHPERVVLVLASAIAAAVLVTAPVSDLFDLIARSALGLGKLERPQDQASAHEELRETIDLRHKEGTVVKNDRDMLGGILAMQDLEVSDIMVHRTRMTMIDLVESPNDIVTKVLKSGHTRIPVWKDTPDNIIGVLHAKNLFAALQKHGGDAAKVDIEDILLPPWFVPDTRAIPDQLNEFLKRKSHFAIVVDEYGEVQGLLTLEDIIEEIVGDIKDEHDAVATGVRPKPDGSYLVDGGVPIRDLNRAFDWTLPDDEANTIAGLVIHEARTIPDVGQAFSFHGFRFEILKKRRHQVTALRMTPLKRDGDEVAAG